jgi:REP element-mobilizing transposase RayT
MKFGLEKHNRKSIRLKGYDYSQAGAYFVTICANNRECPFGEVIDGVMMLNDAGLMIKSAWYELPRHYPGVDIDAVVIMPNHIHGILVLTDFVVGAGPRACPDDGQPQGVACPDDGQPQGVACPDDGQPQGVAPTMSLSDVVHRFKSFTTASYRHGVKKNGWRPFKGKLWQRNYYEHIIRNDDESHRVRQYIADNPAKWHFDRENPATEIIEDMNEEPWRE